LPEELTQSAQESQDSQPEQVVSDADQKLLKQIRDDYSYFLNYWREIRDEFAEDMRYVSGHPFTQAEKDERKELGAPVVEPDEITQYLNQAINNLRQNKRAIKVNPAGQKATDKNAEHRAAIIRGIEYESNAQAAYITGFEAMINGGFGGWRITTDYLNDGKSDDEAEAFNQAPRIKRIPNALTILPDPDAKEADFSDQDKCFVTDTIRKSDFARKYPNAKKQSFSTEDVEIAPDWVKGGNVVIAEYWIVEKKTRRKMRVQRAMEKAPVTLYDDELGKDEKPKVLNERRIEERKVVQYITNGVEILERNEWIGSRIPIIICYGKELYLTEGGRSKRMWLSLTRLARDPQKMLAFVASQEAEEFGMAPRAPLVGAVGQFETDKDAWDSLNKVRRAYVQYDIVTDAAGAVAPPPTRPQFMPNIEAYQVSRESWRRSVQSAIGTSPLPTAAQRRNEKSGVALDKIQQAEAVGSFHFTDNFDRALQNTGWQLNELLTLTLDTPRQVPVQGKDDAYGMLWVTTQEHGKPSEVGEDEEYLIVDQGQYGVTISTGPSFQSQRDEQTQFVDNIVANLAQLPPPGSPPAKILALAIKMKNYGPLADEIVDVLDPQQDENAKVPPQVQAKMAQQQQQLQQLDALAKQLQQEKDAKVVENQTKKEIAAAQEETKKAIAMAQEETKRLQLINQRQIAEITTKAQDARERQKLDAELDSDLHVAAHEVALQKDQQAHDVQQAATQQAHEAEMGQQGHEQALEQGDQAAANQSALAQQAAEQQPEGGESA
jgi:hypothetical protein